MIEKDGKYYERCGDCGGAIIENKVSSRLTVCDECWERRGWIVKNMTKIAEYFGMAEFTKLQRSMAYKSGTAKRKILKWQSEYTGVQG